MFIDDLFIVIKQLQTEKNLDMVLTVVLSDVSISKSFFNLYSALLFCLVHKNL